MQERANFCEDAEQQADNIVPIRARLGDDGAAPPRGMSSYTKPAERPTAQMEHGMESERHLKP
jgi:hypothetical protein